MPLSNLNKEQLQAATAPFGYNLIIASAGTGKTSTIVGRIAHLLTSGTKPQEILLLTFTNKAAGEMLNRLKRYFPDDQVEQIACGTFHAVCYKWLKESQPKLALKQPSELRTLFKSIYERRAFHRMALEVQAFSASHLYEQYLLYQNDSILGFEGWFLAKYPEHEPLLDIYFDIIEEFEEEKKEFGFVSFNDLLLRVKEELSQTTRVYQEVLVDEYQDTNTLQSALIDTLKPSSLFCVGDYDQSIYAFNGANIENIGTFDERYKGAKVHTLSKNYRSAASILSLANRVIEKNERIYPKKLEVVRTGVTTAPKLLIYDDLFVQYQAIAHTIEQSVNAKEDIAVIFRNNASADGIEASLRERGIPCKRKGGLSFFEAKEIKFLLDVLSIIVNPKDMMACINIFEYAPGVGSALAREFFVSLVHFGKGSLFQGILNPMEQELPKFNAKTNRQLGLFDDDEQVGSRARFASLGLLQEVATHPLLKHPKINAEMVRFFEDFYSFLSEFDASSTPYKILRGLQISKLYTRVIDVLSNQRARLKSGEVDMERKEQSKERILRKANLLLELSKPYSELSRFVNAMVLGGGELSEGEGVNLLTVHASKGLEFNEVYVVDLVDGRFPNTRMMSSVEEERRLFYVAVTRAKNSLYLSLANNDKLKKIVYKPSQFLIEAGLLKEEK